MTGASGFIGGHLAARMAAEGRRVRCLVRATSDTTALRALATSDGGGGVELVIGDLTNRFARYPPNSPLETRLRRF